MKRIIICITLCVLCLAAGFILGSYITKNKMQQEMEVENKIQQEMEVKMHNTITQELDDYSDGLLEAAVLYYAGNAYQHGEKLPPDNYWVKTAEQIAWFVSKYLGDLESHRNLNGVGGNYSYYPINCPLSLIRSEAETIANSYKSPSPDNMYIYTKSPWENEITIDKRLLPFKGPMSSPIPPDKMEDA